MNVQGQHNKTTFSIALKETVARDFQPLVFSTNQPPYMYVDPESQPKIFLTSVSNLLKYSYVKVDNPAGLC